jgi:hypothetical protein
LECSDDEEDAEENFFRRERRDFLRPRGCGGEGQKRQMVFFMLFPGFPFLGEHEVEEWSKNLALAA